MTEYREVNTNCRVVEVDIDFEFHVNKTQYNYRG